ncbi:MAG TPA: hypothetical protein VIM56_00370 [Rhizomicrobium sp.]
MRRKDKSAVVHPVASFQLPSDQALLAAVGTVAIAHGHLEYILRMTVKTLAGLSILEALDATNFTSMRDVRSEVRKLFGQLTKERSLCLKLEALLERARKESEQRNQLLHRPWAVDSENNWLMKDEYHHWGPLPDRQQFLELADRIYNLIHDINEARLHGFISDVAKLRNSPKTDQGN